MDQTILEHGVKTIATIKNRYKYVPFIAKSKDTKHTMESILKDTGSITPVIQSVVPDTIKYRVVEFDELNFSDTIQNAIIQLINSGKDVRFLDILIKFPDKTTLKDKAVKVRDYYNPKRKYVSFHNIKNKIQPAFLS